MRLFKSLTTKATKTATKAMETSTKRGNLVEFEQFNRIWNWFDDWRLEDANGRKKIYIQSLQTDKKLLKYSTYGSGNGIGIGTNFFFLIVVAAINAVAAAPRPFFLIRMSKASRLARTCPSASTGEEKVARITSKTRQTATKKEFGHFIFQKGQFE